MRVPSHMYCTQYRSRVLEYWLIHGKGTPVVLMVIGRSPSFSRLLPPFPPIPLHPLFLLSSSSLPPLFLLSSVDPYLFTDSMPCLRRLRDDLGVTLGVLTNGNCDVMAHTTELASMFTFAGGRKPIHSYVHIQLSEISTTVI